MDHKAGGFWLDFSGNLRVHDGAGWCLVTPSDVKLTPEYRPQDNTMDKTLHRARALFDKGSREAILDFLQETDPNGSWTDAASVADGLEPLSFDEALIELQEMIEELEIEQRTTQPA
jgi:hypothetical protein